MIIDRKIPLKYIIKKIGLEFGLALLFTCVVIFSKKYLKIEVSLPIHIPAFLGTAISLVLAFKLNHSYDRWWEARKIWGAIVNDSRTLLIQLKGFCMHQENENVRDMIKEMGFRQIAWTYSLSNSLRNLSPLENLESFLCSKEIEILKGHCNAPLKILDLNANSVKELFIGKEINQYQQIQIDSTIKRLCSSMGRAERIKNTIFPKLYRVFLSFFIYVFILTLAISLSDLQPMTEIVILLAIVLPFILLKRAAHYLQDPFENRPTDVPTESISRVIEINIKQLLDEKEIPQVLDPEDFYIM
jgi:putative membrane protein